MSAARDDLGTCDKCRAPATAFTICRVPDEAGSTCDATYRRCDKCGGEKGAERSVRAHQALAHPLPTLKYSRGRRRAKDTSR